MRAKLGFVLAGLFGLALTLPASAHHAHGNYAAEFGDLQGVVKEVHFLNPHSWIYLDVKNDKGEVETWAIEATGRGQLERMGAADGKYIKPGDTIKARCHFLRDGSTGCLAGFIKARDGSVKDWDGGDAKPEGEF